MGRQSKFSLHAFVLLIAFNVTQAQQLYINEVCISNDTVAFDLNNKTSDWIELYNATNNVIDLEGYFVSDNPNKPEKWKFPANVSIPANGYLLVWASEENKLVNGTEPHTNFELSSEGETILLSAPDTSLIDQIDAVKIATDKSLGRQPNGSAFFYFFDTPSPAVNNSTQVATLLEPVFSDEAGFYTDSFTLTLATANNLDTILYTLDGSEPDINNIGGKFYTIKQDYTSTDTAIIPYHTYMYVQGLTIEDRTSDTNKIAAIRPSPAWWNAPSNIFKGTVVKACAYKTGFNSSDIITKTYFVDPLAAAKYSFPVFSISIDEDKLFDYHTGIHVPGNIYYDNPPGGYWALLPANYSQYGKSWERQGHLEYFVNGQREMDLNIGIRMTGHKSRAWGRKSLRIYARSEYDDENRMRYPIFTGLKDKTYKRDPIVNFKRITIRNFGTYWKKHIFVDAFQQMAVRHLDLDILNSNASVVFVNGEYWGVMNARERPDRFYFNSHYDIDDEDVVIHERHDGTVTTGVQADSIYYMQMRHFICNNDMSIQANFDSASTYMDVENFAKLFMAHIYVNNTDWTEVDRKCWRKRTAQYMPNAPYGHDGRFRWVFYDLDHGYVDEEDDKINEYMTDNGSSTCMFRGLMANNQFKNYWINLLADHMNSTFLPSRIQNMIDSLTQLYAPEMSGHTHRWQGYYSMVDINLFNWTRQHYMKEDVLTYFNEVTDTIQLSVDVTDASKGSVQVNSILINSNTPGVDSTVYPWSGGYFSGIPVRLIAKPKDGYKFIEWLGTGITSDTLFADLTSDSLLVAVFGSADTVFQLHINELLSKNDDIITDDFQEFDDYIELYNSSSNYIELRGLYLSDDAQNNLKWRIPDEIPALGPNEFVRFWADNDEQQGPFHTNFKLSEETVYLHQLLATDTILLDSLSTAAALYVNISNGRYPNGQSTIQLFDFPTPNASNDLPGPFTDIFINEFMCNNTNTIADEVGEFDDWIELYNAGSVPVNVAGLFLTDDFNQVDMHRIPFNNPDSTTIQAGGFMLLWADNDLEQGIRHVGFKLNNVSEQIGLHRHSVLYSSVLDTISYNSVGSGSYGRQSDGSALWSAMNPTPAASNNITISPFINEDDCCLLFPNPTDDFIQIKGEAIEVVQLFDMNGVRLIHQEVNTTTTTIDLSTLLPNIYIIEIKTQHQTHISKVVKINHP